MSELRMRHTARAVVLDPAGHVLLVHHDMRSWGSIAVWATPGGRIEDGETPLDAVRRELVEEVGLAVGPDEPEPLWRDERVSPLICRGWDGSVDEVFLVRTERFEPRGAFSDEQLADEEVTDVRWWDPAGIATSEELFSPRDLGERLRALPPAGTTSG